MNWTLFSRTRPVLGLCLLLLGGWAAAGCGASSSATPAPRSPAASTSRVRSFSVPAGVDTSVASHADALADSSFVSVQKQEQAAEQVKRGRALISTSDSLWHYLTLSRDTSYEVSPEEKNDAIRAYNRGATALQELGKLSEQADVDSTQLQSMNSKLLNRAERAFEEAIRLNPFDDQTKVPLAQVYALQARRLGKKGAYQKAIEKLEGLTRLRPSQHGLFNSLGNYYYETEQWDEAAANYEQAEQVYRDYIETSLAEEAELDSTVLYRYANAQGSAYTEARNAEQALAAYQQALTLAPTPEERTYVEDEIEWLNWDDGNIAAVFARDSLARLANRGRYAEAAQGFEQLKRRLQTQSARYWTVHRLAQVEYQLGEQDQAVERLQGLVKKIPTTPDGAPRDSSYAPYVSTYGTIAYNMGVEYRTEKKDNRTALKYLEQSARVPWQGRAKALLEVAKLLRNNLSKAVEYAEQARRREEQLSLAERRELYRNLVDFNRRLGNRSKAAQYADTYRGLRQE